MAKSHWVAAVVAVALSSSAVYAQATPQVLAGVHSVAPFVINNTELSTGASDSARVQQVMELELRRVGIPVVPWPEKTGGVLWLTITSMPAKDRGGRTIGYIYAMVLQYGEMVAIGHGVGTRIATTYQLPTQLGSGSMDAAAPGDQFARVATQLVDQFANDYLTANPKH